jgi:hypothetical protein
VIGDGRLPMQAREALRTGFDYEEARVQTFPMKFACPSAVLRKGDMNSGGTDISHPGVTPWRRVELLKRGFRPPQRLTSLIKC